MPSCCIKQCGARKSNNQPTLTLHRFPVNETLRRKWIEMIGIENINPRHKMWHVCSMHFHETSFNRTLEVTRLRDGAVPLRSLLAGEIYPKTILDSQPTSSATIAVKSSKPVLCERQNLSSFPFSMEVELPDDNSNKNAHTEDENQEKNEKIKNLTEKCDSLKRKVKSLNEKLRRRDRKIAIFSDIIQDLKKGKYINTQETLILEECAGPEDFLTRQIAKSKGLPLEKKYSEELRKFALTLHFYSPKAYEFIRKTYNTCLPHTRTLSKWYQHIDAEPGFTKEAFVTLTRKVKETVQPVICALTLDEMAIRKCLTWDPKAQKFYGRVDLGHDVNSDSVDEASQCLVLLVTAINGSWKLPIGFVCCSCGHHKQN